MWRHPFIGHFYLSTLSKGLCKSKVLSVNLGICGVYSSYQEPGATVIYHCLNTAAPSALSSACSLWATASTDPCLPPRCSRTASQIKSEKRQRQHTWQNQHIKSVQSPEWMHIAEVWVIFFELQCSTKHFSIAFTWMFRLANALLKPSRWRRWKCLLKWQTKLSFYIFELAKCRTGGRKPKFRTHK